MVFHLQGPSKLTNSPILAPKNVKSVMNRLRRKSITNRPDEHVEETTHDIYLSDGFNEERDAFSQDLIYPGSEGRAGAGAFSQDILYPGTEDQHTFSQDMAFPGSEDHDAFSQDMHAGRPISVSTSSHRMSVDSYISSDSYLEAELRDEGVVTCEEAGGCSSLPRGTSASSLIGHTVDHTSPDSFDQVKLSLGFGICEEFQNYLSQQRPQLPLSQGDYVVHTRSDGVLRYGRVTQICQDGYHTIFLGNAHEIEALRERLTLIDSEIPQGMKQLDLLVQVCKSAIRSHDFAVLDRIANNGLVLVQYMQGLIQGPAKFAHAGTCLPPETIMENQLFGFKADFLVGRSYVHQENQNYLQGLADADAALELSKGNAEALMRRATALHSLGHVDEALTVYERALKMQKRETFTRSKSRTRSSSNPHKRSRRPSALLKRMLASRHHAGTALQDGDAAMHDRNSTKAA